MCAPVWIPLITRILPKFKMSQLRAAGSWMPAGRHTRADLVYVTDRGVLMHTCVLEPVVPCLRHFE